MHSNKPTDYNLFSTLLLVLSRKHPIIIISLLASNLSTGSKSHNAYNTKFSLSHTSHFNLNSLLLFQLLPLVHPQLSPSIVLPMHLDSKLLTDPSYATKRFSVIHCPIYICLFSLQHDLLKPTTLSSHCLPLNSANNWKSTFSFNPILPRPSPLQSWQWVTFCDPWPMWPIGLVTHGPLTHDPLTHLGFLAIYLVLYSTVLKITKFVWNLKKLLC